MRFTYTFDKISDNYQTIQFKTRKVTLACFMNSSLTHMMSKSCSVSQSGKHSVQVNFVR